MWHGIKCYLFVNKLEVQNLTQRLTR